MRPPSYAPALLCSCLLAGMPAPAAGRADPPAGVVVEGTDQDLGETPVVVAVDPRPLPPGRYLLRRGVEAEAPLAATAYRDAGKTWLAFVLPAVPARATTHYALAPDPAPPDDARGVALHAEGARVAIRLDGKPWTNYVPDDGPKPYFDPLIGPSGLPLTRAWPMREVVGEPRDHPHHRSLWFAHLDVNKANTWDQNPGHGSIRETSRPTVAGGGAIGVLRTTDEWLDRAGRPVCDDERLVLFYATRAARVLDFEVTLRATRGPLRIGDNKDGVFAVRMAGPMAVTARQGGRIVNSRGQVDKAAWGQPAEWVDYTGPVGGETMGIAILDNPASFRHPTTWHVRDYGLFAANPFGWHDFGQPRSGEHEVAAGGSIRLAYRVILHRGATDPADLGRQFRGLATPPRVTLE